MNRGGGRERKRTSRGERLDRVVVLPIPKDFCDSHKQIKIPSITLNLKQKREDRHVSLYCVAMNNVDNVDCSPLSSPLCERDHLSHLVSN